MPRVRFWLSAVVVALGLALPSAARQPGSEKKDDAPAKSTTKPAAKKATPAKTAPGKLNPSKSAVSKATVAAANKLAADSLESLLKGEDAKTIEAALDAELVRLAEEADPVSDVEAFFAISRASRLAALHSRTTDPAVRETLVQAVRGAPKFANELAMSLTTKDDLAKVAELAGKLWRAEGARLNDFSTLGAAICVVHDREVFVQANENKVVADDPLKLFAYFAGNETKFPLGLKNVPVQLLVLVVDATAKVSELQWALDRYRADRGVGARFFEIQYDVDHFRNGAPKKVTSQGLTLQNISKFGGVCIDQAYYAANVGKACGIPATIMTGRSAEVSHAWVSYLVWNGQTAVFDSRSGRYPEYRSVIGYITDPQTGQRVIESELSLRAWLSLTAPDKRQRAIALEDAGYALADKLLPKDEGLAMDASGRVVHEKLTPEMATRILAISEAAANLCPGSARAWRLGVNIGVTGNWTVEQRNRWGEAIFKTMVGGGYVGFAADCLITVINSVQDVSEQNKMWNWLFQGTSRNGDIASIVRFNQAEMFERDHTPEKAWECYEWILKLYADTSPMAVAAAQRVLVLLKDNGKSIGEGAKILGEAWARTTPPSSLNPAFASQSNWFRLGVLYRAALKDAGQTTDYTRVSTQLGLKP
ncbi:MAG: hypothetical protein J0L78_01120 [Planctomycetes bacterium]|nr:hypothetical protein [Planctomycetota bacterium]